MVKAQITAAPDEDQSANYSDLRGSKRKLWQAQRENYKIEQNKIKLKLHQSHKFKSQTTVASEDRPAHTGFTEVIVYLKTIWNLKLIS